MAFQSGAFQSDAFQMVVRSSSQRYRRVWLPDKDTAKAKIEEAKATLKEIKEKAEGFSDIEDYGKKLDFAVSELKQTGGVIDNELVYDIAAMQRLEQILLSIQYFEESILEILALLILIDEGT